MGAYRAHRPFVWQDEMAEVKNLFGKVAKVRDSGFRGFSIGKDEPTAKTLSRNRLRRRRCQYALELTHLNYGESPYEALNHLHNIRGMCSRIQRQDCYVERKKKDYDLDLQPALLRRPVTASYFGSSNKECSDKASLRSSRPGSAPIMAGTPLYFTPSKPTTLYDATHRCPRNKEITSHSPMLNSSKIHDRQRRSAMKVMTNSSSLETTPIASTWCSSSGSPSSIASSTKTNLRGTPSACLSSRLNTDSSLILDEPISMTKMSLKPAYIDAETASDDDNTAALASYCEGGLMEASLPSSNRVPAVNVVERPPSRMMSKRPSQDLTKAILATKHDANVPCCKDDHAPPRESTGHELTGSIFASSTRQGIDVVTTQSSRPPSSGTVEGGRLFDKQMCKSNRIDATTSKGKYEFPPSEGNGGLWALKQEQQTPISTGATMPQVASTMASLDEPHFRPRSSPAQVGPQAGDNKVPTQERVIRFDNNPSTNKIGGEEQLKGHVVQRTFGHELNSEYGSQETPERLIRFEHQELQTIVHSKYGCEETHKPSTRSEHLELKAPPAVSLAQSCHQELDQANAFDSRDDTFKEVSIASARVNEQPSTTASGSGESHVMIRHSTDPFTDFKYSMLRMIDEENLYDKQWELEELFQYYMDLNPAVHHEVLRMVISDIRRNLATYKAHRCYPDSP